ncbi:AAA family ATPase [Armatimonas sp.]|uniref:AAA family ATPase n=1 Tax=Armatimonas sp. TaxID=1872638 RepID=UPI0037525C4D
MDFPEASTPLSDLPGLTPEDAAARLRISTKTLRNWESWGWIAPAERTQGGRRRYSEQALQIIEATGMAERGKRVRTMKKETEIGTKGSARSATVIAVVNHKGGSAKTTSVVNLAGVFAVEKKLRVLVVDLDSQANCTIGLGFSPYTLTAKRQLFISDVLLPGGSPQSGGGYTALHNIRDAILHTEIEGLDLVPSSLQLSDAEIPLINAMARETTLSRALAHLRNDYDLILIDCPPSLGIFTTNALWAADHVLVPVEAANYAVAGLTAIVNVVRAVRELGRDVNILGVFNTRVPGPLTNSARDALENTKRIFASTYIDIPIGNTVASERAVEEGNPMVVSSPKHKVSESYRQLAEEVLRRVG